MFTRWFSGIGVAAAALLFLASPSQAVTLSLNFSGGSVADRITDSFGTPLDAGDQIFLYGSSTALDSSDLFSSIFQVLPGGGLSFLTPADVLLTTSIGISPPLNLDGTVRGQLDLGNIQSPTVATGTFLFLIAIDAGDLGLATEAGISSDSFPVPALPDMNGLPPLPVEFDAGGFATVPVPEPGTGTLLLAGLLVLAGRRNRPSSES
jgi:hypothetical protein